MKRCFDGVECNDRYHYDMFNIIRFIFGLMYKKRNLYHCTHDFLMIIGINATKYSKKHGFFNFNWTFFFIVISKCLTTQLYQLQNRLLFLKQ